MRRFVASSLTCLAATALFVFVALHTGRAFDWALAGAAAIFTLATITLTLTRGRAAARGRPEP